MRFAANSKPLCRPRPAKNQGYLDLRILRRPVRTVLTRQTTDFQHFEGSELSPKRRRVLADSKFGHLAEEANNFAFFEGKSLHAEASCNQ